MAAHVDADKVMAAETDFLAGNGDNDDDDDDDYNDDAIDKLWNVTTEDRTTCRNTGSKRPQSQKRSPTRG